MTVTKCPHCGKAFRIKPDFAGRKATCRECGKKFVINIDTENAAGTEKSNDEALSVIRKHILSLVIASGAVIILLTVHILRYSYFSFSHFLLVNGKVFYYFPFIAAGGMILRQLFVKKITVSVPLMLSLLLFAESAIFGIIQFQKEPPDPVLTETSISGIKQALPFRDSEIALQLINELKKDNNRDFEKEIAVLGLGRVLTAYRLTSSKGIETAESTLKQFTALLNKYKKNIAETHEKIQAKLEQLGLPESRKKKVLEGFADARKNEDEMFGDLFTTRFSLAGTWNDYLFFLKSHQHEYSLSDGKISFKSDDLETENKRFSRSIADLKERESQKVLSLRQYRLRQLQNAKSLLNLHSFK